MVRKEVARYEAAAAPSDVVLGGEVLGCAWSTLSRVLAS
jgi:hypothetical protein